MNIVEDFRRDEQRILDRLVDGELGQAERRALLAAFDDEPGAWRRCALAFLEAQTFRWQLTRVAAAQSLEDTRCAEAAMGATAPAKRSHIWGLWLAVAASLLVAFGLGTRFPTSTSSMVAVAPSPVDNETATKPVEEGDALPQSEPADDLPETMTLAMTGSEDGEGIELPVAAAGQDDQQWLSQLGSSLPASLLDRLQAAGLEVVRRQRLFPVDLSDGRRLMVPVEQVDIRQPQHIEGL